MTLQHPSAPDLPRLLLAALLVMPAVAHAQGGPAGNDFVAWVDSVASAPSGAALDALRANTQVWNGGQRSLARGWWQLRRGVVTGNANTVEAGIRVLVIERTAQRESPWPAYFLARGFHDLSVLRAPIRSNLAQPEGESNVATFWHLLVPLIDAHPAFAPAARLATDALLALGDRTLRPDELTVLRTLLLREPSNADLMIVEARRLRATGAMPAALARFDAARTHGGDRGVLGLERARTLAVLGRVAEGEAAYWEGMTALTPAGREAYRTDLAWFVHPDTLAPFDRVPTDSVHDWLQRFWLERDALAANRPGERLQEQLLRWNDAFRDYHVPLPWRRAQFGRVEHLFEELDLCLNNAGRRLQEDLARLQPSLTGDTRSDEPILDHRGLIVLRHGLPVRRVHGRPAADTDTTIQKFINRRGANLAPALRAEVMAESMRFNESWVYWLEGRWRTFSFRGSQALGYHAATTLMSYLPLTDAIGRSFAADWQLRVGLSEEWARADARLRERPTAGNPRAITCDDVFGAAVRQQRVDAQLGIATDSDSPPMHDPWPSAIAVYGLGHDAATGKALIALAIPRDRLESTPVGDGRRDQPVQIRVTAYERSSGRFVALDSLVHFLSRDTDFSGSFANQLLELPLTPGSWRVAVKLTQGIDTTGSYALLPELTIGPSSRMTMSDLVLGRAGGAAWKTPHGGSFPVNTLGTWPRRDEAAVYYEVYGARTGDTLQSRIEIRSLAPGRGSDRISAAFREVVGDGPVSVERRLGLAELRGGQYELKVTIESSSGSVSRQQRLIVTVP